MALVPSCTVDSSQIQISGSEKLGLFETGSFPLHCAFEVESIVMERSERHPMRLMDHGCCPLLLVVLVRTYSGGAARSLFSGLESKKFSSRSLPVPVPPDHTYLRL